MQKYSWLLVAALAVCALPTAVFAASTADFTPGMYTDGTGSTPYQLHVPANYDPNKEYPLVLFLHGAGERGDNNTSQINSNINNLLNHVKMPEYEAFLLAPQASGWWSGNETARAHNILQNVQTQYNINTDQVFCTGLSMGGGGTWDMAARFTDSFDAFVPICGTGPNIPAAINIAHQLKPTWVFHAADDGTVGVNISRQMVAAIQDNGGTPIYTEYATGGHGIWGRAYNETDLYDWMFSYPTMGEYGPQLVYQKQDLGNGLYGYTFVIENNDGKELSYAATLSFQGVNGASVQNVQINDTDINDEAAADFASQFGFDPETDTYSLDPFAAVNAIPGNSTLWGDTFTGYREGEGWWEMSVGTGASSQYGSGVTVAYVVANGDISWSGVISRDSQNYDVAGVTPEPTSLVLLALGGLAALRRRNR